jgi:hypothetical protein
MSISTATHIGAATQDSLGPYNWVFMKLELAPSKA